MRNLVLSKSLIELGSILVSLYELDWFHNLVGLVNYNKSKDKEMIKEKVDHVMGGLSILYLFAIFESYYKKSNWDTYINPDDLKLLRAYRYIRHCIAHGHHGKKIKPKYSANVQEYNDFEDAIKNNLFNPHGLIKVNQSDDSIIINSTIGIYLKDFMVNITQYSIAKCS